MRIGAMECEMPHPEVLPAERQLARKRNLGGFGEVCRQDADV